MEFSTKAALLGIQTVHFDGLGRERRASPGALAVVAAALEAGLQRPPAPEKGPPPVPRPAFQGHFDRVWVLAVQLYSIRSRRNWGIGDFTDLEHLITLAADVGAAGIGLNPLHALFDDRPRDCSPYSPNSRLFLNPLYIDIEKLPGFAASDVKNADQLEILRAAPLIDYAAVSALKTRMLRQAYEQFKTHSDAEQRAQLDAFRTERGDTLARFAAFEVLRHRFRAPWWEWPADWRIPDDARLKTLRAEGGDVGYVEFVQWIADRQLGACRDLARKLGLPVGLYLDVAVGVQADGFDAWNEQVAITRTLSVGAPPDMLNTAGQNWGLAGFNPIGLKQCNFDPFRQMLRASMRYAGAIRLDHVLGLKRLYVIPSGLAADEGLYVAMPFERLLAGTADESRTHACVIIGEDLGTVPEGFRDVLSCWGLWSYRVMIFERDWDGDGEFRTPNSYATNALVTFSTHDLPPFASWVSGHDIAVKLGLGIDPGETVEQRNAAVTALRRSLRSEGIAGDDFIATAAYLARTPSRLLVIALEDLLGSNLQPNVPGTVHEHPNWRQRPDGLLETFADNRAFRRLHDAMKREGRSA